MVSTPHGRTHAGAGLARVTSEHSYLEAGRQAAAALALPGLPDAFQAKLLAAQCVTKIMVNDFVDLESDLTTALGLARAYGQDRGEPRRRGRGDHVRNAQIQSQLADAADAR